MGVKSFVFSAAVLWALASPAATNEYSARVTKVIDGDTVVANIGLGFGISMESHCRLYGINTPELHGGTWSEVASAHLAKNFLSSMVSNRTVKILSLDDRRDKYGRVLAIIVVDGTNVNQALLDMHYAVPMDDDGKSARFFWYDRGSVLPGERGKRP